MTLRDRTRPCNDGIVTAAINVGKASTSWIRSLHALNVLSDTLPSDVVYCSLLCTAMARSVSLARVAFDRAHRRNQASSEVVCYWDVESEQRIPDQLLKHCGVLTEPGFCRDCIGHLQVMSDAPAVISCYLLQLM